MTINLTKLSLGRVAAALVVLVLLATSCGSHSVVIGSAEATPTSTPVPTPTPTPTPVPVPTPTPVPVPTPSISTGVACSSSLGSGDDSGLAVPNGTTAAGDLCSGETGPSLVRRSVAEMEDLVAGDAGCWDNASIKDASQCAYTGLASIEVGAHGDFTEKPYPTLVFDLAPARGAVPNDYDSPECTRLASASLDGVACEGGKPTGQEFALPLVVYRLDTDSNPPEWKIAGDADIYAPELAEAQIEHLSLFALVALPEPIEVQIPELFSTVVSEFVESTESGSDIAMPERVLVELRVEAELGEFLGVGPEPQDIVTVLQGPFNMEEIAPACADRASASERFTCAYPDGSQVLLATLARSGVFFVAGESSVSNTGLLMHLPEQATAEDAVDAAEDAMDDSPSSEDKEEAIEGK